LGKDAGPAEASSLPRWLSRYLLACRLASLILGVGNLAAGKNVVNSTHGIFMARITF
jgi:hypothetical protein